MPNDERSATLALLCALRDRAEARGDRRATRIRRQIKRLRRTR